jgi:tRNA-binding protein
VLEIDFGCEIGRKTTSAQIVEAYRVDEIIGRQVVAIVNFPAKKVADVWSQALVLGVVRGNGPTILLAPGSEVENGARVL